MLLGATAAQTLLGKDVRVSRQYGVPIASDLAELVVATVHPSAVLRAPNREEAFDGLVDDLRWLQVEGEDRPRWRRDNRGVVAGEPPPRGRAARTPAFNELWGRAAGAMLWSQHAV